jgi:hypothetical protein
LTLGGLQAKHGDDDCRHDRQFRGHYREDREERYEHKHRGRPEGLPPGLERQLARNGHLPPGLERKMRPVPEMVCRRLPPLPPDTVRGFYGSHVIVYNPRTLIVFDVFAGITLGR